ncbi:MAG: D-alanyl-D-alanine carboxypeptidase family protein [Clostridia bacterium]|nr:D-alanyl-D-alanine carboxypeptidase family protein [Clostridia bacterium]
MNRSPNQSNRPRRNGLTPQQEAQRAEWHRYAAEEQARRQAEAAARRRAAEERRRREEEERKARRAEAWRLFRIRFVMYLIAVALMLAVLGIVFFVSLHKTEQVDPPRQVTYTIGTLSESTEDADDSARELTYRYSEAVRDGVFYFPMPPLTGMLSLTVTGTPDEQRYITPAGEYACFTVGSATADVNGDLLTLEGPVRLSEENGVETLWIPLSFMTDWMEGMQVNVDAEKGTVVVACDPDVDAAFLLKGDAPAASIDEMEEFGDTAPIPFKSDLTAYEEYMNPADRDAYLILINVENKLSSSYIPTDLTELVDTRKDGRNPQKMRLYAAKALEAFFIEMRACGITDVSVTSGYRSYSYQEQLFADRVAMYPSLSREEAEAKAATVVAIPGSSEHQSGLCIDMHNLPSADISFANQAAFTWISQNAHKFGFILRFPEDKTEITGISYEPWHYRYVGRYHATRIYESGLCLEEYMAAYTQ